METSHPHHPSPLPPGLKIRLERLFSPLGLLSPFATFETFSPGAQRLLGGMEQETERLLHIVRLVFVVAMTSVYVFGLRLIDVVPTPLILAGATLALTLWVVVWRYLNSGPPPFRVRMALCMLDAAMVGRGFVMAQVTLEVGNGGAAGLISVADLQAITPPMLVYLAITGAFRLDPRLAISPRC